MTRRLGSRIIPALSGSAFLFAVAMTALVPSARASFHTTIPPTPSPSNDPQQRFGTGWVENYLNIPRAAGIATLLEMLPALGAPGYLKRNEGLFSPEVIDYYQRYLPFYLFRAPWDVIKDLPPPEPAPGKNSPFLSDAKTKDGIRSWGDLLSDLLRSTPVQMGMVNETLAQRTLEHMQALGKEIDDGEGRLGLSAPGNATGIGGHNIGRNVIPSGDIKALAEGIGVGALRELATIQDPGPLPALPPDVPLPPNFNPLTPKPPENPSVPGGSAAGSQLAQNLGILSPDPFGSIGGIGGIDPSIFIGSIINNINNFLNGLSDNVLNNFGGTGPLGDLANLFGPDRLRDALSRGGGRSSKPSTTNGPEAPPQCTFAAARRPRQTVENAALALQLPGPWTVSLQRATEAFRALRGTEWPTDAPLTVRDRVSADACVWVVSVPSLDDAVFVDDTRNVVFRLRNIE